jgi:hypothetical protein
VHLSLFSDGRDSRELVNPDTLRQIRPNLLLAWLTPVRGCLEKRGLHWPEIGAEPTLDLDALAAILMQPSPDMTSEMVDSLYLIHEMANPSGMDALLAEAEGKGVRLAAGEDLWPADVAVQAWLLYPRLLERVPQLQEMTRPRSFTYFSTDADPVLPFAGPTPEQPVALEARLDRFYRAWKRGLGARVFAYRWEDEWWFLVRHELPCRRERDVFLRDLECISSATRISSQVRPSTHSRCWHARAGIASCAAICQACSG